MLPPDSLRSNFAIPCDCGSVQVKGMEKRSCKMPVFTDQHRHVEGLNAQTQLQTPTAETWRSRIGTK